jgi:hypothetical protein
VSRDVLKYEVWLGRDDEGGEINVVVTAVEYGGQMSIIGSKIFECWARWDDIAAWVWNHIRLDGQPAKV